MKQINKILLIFIFILLSTTAINSFAGSAQIDINCKSGSGKTQIIGYVPGDSIDYDLKINIDKSNIRYVDACSDVRCSNREKNFYLII